MRTSSKIFSSMRTGFLGVLFVGLSCVATSAYAQLTLTSGSNATTTPNVATSITGFQIVGNAASTTPVQLRVTSGSLSMTTTTGLTFDGSSTGSTINFTGTVANINAALATLRYTRSNVGTDTLEVSLVNKGEVFFLDNNHLYKYIAGSFTWDNARIAAENQTLYGATGYLATITSLAENNFVYSRIAGNGWLGTTDIQNEKTWRWVTGPEAGTAYFQENPVGGGGSAISGRYHGWASGEPNDYAPGEDCGYMYATQGGEWNDFPCSASQGYVVEFGADGNMPTVVAKNISIVTADVPAITVLSPANSATAVQTTANGVITFSKTVIKDTGTILLKRGSDDVTIESIDVAGSKVTGGGTTAITINPDTVLEEGVTYYFIIPNTAFKDASDNFFEGITATTTWRFTTGDFTAPTISDVTATSTATSSAQISWTTNETSSSRVTYGLTTSYGSNTSEADISPRVTSHTVSLTGLLACTTYHYRVISRDAALNTATSSDSSFITLGCEGNGITTAATSTAITSASGGSTTIAKDFTSMTVTAPPNFTSTSSSVVIQVKATDNTPVLETYGRPASAPKEIGLTIFDVKAIIDGTTVLDSFDHPVTIDYQYSDSDMNGLDESTLWLYHYHNGSWQALDDCTLNKVADTISCTTQSFSLFGLFGSPSVSSSVTYASSYFVYLPQQELTAPVEPVVVVGTSTPTITTPRQAYQFTKNLRLGVTHEEVKELQKFLNTQGFMVSTTGVGSPGKETTYFGAKTKKALVKFQERYPNDILIPQDLPKGTGHFLGYTRTFVNSLLAR